MLVTFAREEALAVAHHWKAPDLVQQFLSSGDKQLAVAALAEMNELATRTIPLGERSASGSARFAISAYLSAYFEKDPRKRRCDAPMFAKCAMECADQLKQEPGTCRRFNAEAVRGFRQPCMH